MNQNSIVNGLSIDLEDWFQGLTSTSRQFERWNEFEARVWIGTNRLLEILDDAETKATFFVLGYLAQQHPDLIQVINQKGHEIACHGFRHRLVYEMSAGEFEQDLKDARSAIEPWVDRPLEGFRAPALSIDPRSSWALPILERLGFRYDSSVAPTRNPLYGWPNAPQEPHIPEGVVSMIELPISTFRFLNRRFPFGGGFYFRAYPYFLTSMLIRRLNRKGMPAFTYFHPWEFDPQHPRPESITQRERISHYTNLGLTEQRLRRLLREFQFAPYRDLVQALEASSAPLATGRD